MISASLARSGTPSAVASITSAHSRKYCGPRAAALEVLNDTIQQSLKRDESWKEFYVEKMETVVSDAPSGHALEIFELELKAEKEFAEGSPQNASKIIQSLIDTHVSDDSGRGWYLQEIARLAPPIMPWRYQFQITP